MSLGNDLEVGGKYLVQITRDGESDYAEVVVKQFVQAKTDKLVRLEDKTGREWICRIQDVQIIEKKGRSLNE